jgi:hypothetical protein
MLALVSSTQARQEKTMMVLNTVRRSGAVVALTAALAVPTLALATAPAHASGGSGVEARGTCGTGVAWKLKAKHDNGRIEVEYEVDSNRVGQLWTVTLTDDNVRVFSGQRRTLAPSGSFTVRALTTDRSGADVIRSRATFGGRTCSGAVSV